MNKYILGLTAIAILCSPLAYADDTLGSSTAITATPTSTTTVSTTPQSTQSVVQLKKPDGTTINATVNSQDLNSSNMGNTLTVITVTPIMPTTTIVTTPPPTTAPAGTTITP